METSFKRVRWQTLAPAIGLVALAIGWWSVVQTRETVVTKPEIGATVAPGSNAIRVIAPYWYSGTWVFDDASVGLVREPFVAGVPEMIDSLVKEIPDARSGFRLYFSDSPFPGHQKELSWLRSESKGNWYRLSDPQLEGWLCPALFHYYPSAPKTIYVKAEAKR